MYTLNGIGTTLYGRRHLSHEELNSMGIRPIEGLKPYIATKWFVFLFIPLIPFSSYVVFLDYAEEKGTFLSSKRNYHMVKINMNWNQIFKTWTITLAVLFLLWLFFR